VHYDAISRLAQERLYDFAKPPSRPFAGSAFGAGISLAVCCDVRIASQSARFSIPAGKLGLEYPAAGVKKLVDLVGPARTMELFYTADQWAATQALAAGLVERVVSNEEFDVFARDYGWRIAGH
jgi:enoyl-CoA hydratase